MCFLINSPIQIGLFILSINYFLLKNTRENEFLFIYKIIRIVFQIIFLLLFVLLLKENSS